MAGPTTEYLSGQLDQLRNETSALRAEAQLARVDAIDRFRKLGDTFRDQIHEVREQIGGELAGLRHDVGAGTEALKVDQSQVREHIVRLQTQTGELIARFDSALGFMKALLIALISVGVTVALAAAGAFWNASRMVHAVEDHGRRIERIEGAGEDKAKLQRTLDRIQKTLDDRLPEAGK
jgi:hypothetical protein